MDDHAFIEVLLAVLVERGTDWCYDEEVSQLQHAVQGAILARSEQGSSEAVSRCKRISLEAQQPSDAAPTVP